MEVKFLLRENLMEAFLERLAPFTVVDPFLVSEGKGRTSYPITSLYFDSFDLHCLAEQEAGLLGRRKVRLRTYSRRFTETEPCFFEIKRRHDVMVTKDRLSLSAGHLTPDVSMSQLYWYLLKRVDANQDVAEEAKSLGAWLNLQSTALVGYDRVPFAAKQDPDMRVTVDRDLWGIWQPPSILGELPEKSYAGGYVAIEWKSSGTIPRWFHQMIMDFELERSAFSKYGSIVRALRPGSMRETGGTICRPSFQG
jgi:hypothetical protein